MNDELLDELEERAGWRGQQVEDDPDNDRWLARHVGSLVAEVRSLRRLVYPDPGLSVERLHGIMRRRPDDSDIEVMNAEILRLWTLEEAIISVWVAHQAAGQRRESAGGE